MRRTVVAALLAWSLALAGCGQSSLGSARAPASSSAAGVVLGFWRAVSAHRYRQAYHGLGAPLRRSLTYGRFVASAASAGVVFARLPRIARVDGTGRVRTVYVASSRGALARPDAVQVVFMVRRFAAGWRIVSAPGVPTGP